MISELYQASVWSYRYNLELSLTVRVRYWDNSRPIALAIRVLVDLKRVQASWNFITECCRLEVRNREKPIISNEF